MTNQPVQSAAGRQPLYQNTWWRLGFNAVWVLISLALVVLLLGVGAAVTGGRMLEGHNIQNIVWTWLALVLILPPIILIIASGGLDLSVGAVIGLCSVLVAQSAAGGSLLAAAVGGFFVALVIGLVNGLLAGGTRIPGALVTLAMATLLRGVSLVITGGKPVVAGSVGWLAAPIFPWAMLTLSIAFGVVWSILVYRHRAGAKPGADYASRWARLLYTGLPYVVSSLMAGFVGLVYVGRLQAGLPTLGTGFEVDEILIALLGGVPLSSLLIANGSMNLAGGLLAALALALRQNVIVLANVPAALNQVADGLVVLGTALVSYLYYSVVGLLPFGGQKRS
jgi:ribose/xylose/arabinose/galactoside ABC-type transport system permease subunit